MHKLPRSSAPLNLLVFIVILVLTAGHLYAAEQKKPGGPAFNISDFVYSTENRRNPFEPINLLKVKQKRESGTAKAGYELEELRFVGAVKSGQKRMAMMEDMQGKGVILKKGDFINNNLWVVDIPDNKVVLGYKLKGEVKKIDIDLPKK